MFNKYDDERFGLSASVSKEISQQWRVGLSGSVGFVNIDDVDADAPGDVEDVEGSNFVPVVGIDVRYRNDESFDLWEDRYEFTGKYELLGADAAGQRLTVSGAWRTPLFGAARDTRQRFSLRGTVGVQHAFGGEVPFFERFQAGGARGEFPLRGFRFHGVGPRDSGVTLGGAFAYSATAEYGFPVYSTFDPIGDEQIEHVRGSLFVDVGSVSDDFSSFLTEPRAAIGVGVLVRLPFLGETPVGLDFGIPPSKRETRAMMS